MALIGEEAFRKLGFWDLKLVGWAGIAFGLAVADLFPDVLRVPVGWFLILTLLLLLKPIYKVVLR